MISTWSIEETAFEPESLPHKETIFTIGNGYLSTRGAFEEVYPGDRRATFVHGVFDDVPTVFTELVNAPDWLPFHIFLNGERFGLERGKINKFERSLDLSTGLLRRRIDWTSPGGMTAVIEFERFASLADQHCLFIRCKVTPDFSGMVEFRAAINGSSDNEGFAHWKPAGQGRRGDLAYLCSRTRQTNVEYVSAMRLEAIEGSCLTSEFWDADNAPTLILRMAARPGETLAAGKYVAVATSRDDAQPLELALTHLAGASWQPALEANASAWADVWRDCDVEIDGDDEAQLAVRFCLYQLQIAAPRHDDRVNIGAKTLSGFGYRGHSFWDTEIFMLPVFIYTAPQIARNLLNYRYQRLAGARAKAKMNGYEGAQFPWESADTGEEVTPTWVPHFADRTKIVRIWTGDIEIHISADIAYAVIQYWRASGDDAWFIAKGAELVLDTARFWASRAEWNVELNRFEYNNVIGPDEYHDRIDNNAYTNRMAQWNLETGLEVLAWLADHAPQRYHELVADLDLSPEKLTHWREVIAGIYLNIGADGLIEQFEGFYQRKYIDLAALEPRSISAQQLFDIDGCAETQVLKQPDVLMLQYLLKEQYTPQQVRTNYEFYSPRTDHTYGSSLGPSIQTIMACEVNLADDAYVHFMRAARADLRDERGNAGDGIHGASAGGVWQAVVFGFAGLRLSDHGWKIRPRLPMGWKRLKFHFFDHGQRQVVEVWG